VLYVPQRPALLPGSPRDFLDTIHRFKSRQNPDGTAEIKADHVESSGGIAENWGIEAELWDRPWVSLSGGEAQRMALAIAVGIEGTEVLLLDGEQLSTPNRAIYHYCSIILEPTSALDSGSVDVVEKVLKDLPHSDSSSVKAVVCITHSEEQAARLATRRLRMGNGCVSEAHDV
jgi:ABC-type iron transport system FetAB ATPase subunit